MAIDLQSILNAGAGINSAQSYQQFQQNLVMAQAQLQLQANANQQRQIRQQQANQALAFAQANSTNYIAQLNAIQSQKDASAAIRTTLNFQNQLSDLAYGNMMINIDQLQRTQAFDLKTSRKIMNKTRGELLSAQSGSGVEVNYGSLNDILRNVISEQEIDAQNQYKNTGNKIREIASKALSIQLEKQFREFDANEQIQSNLKNLVQTLNPNNLQNKDAFNQIQATNQKIWEAWANLLK